MDCPVCLKPIDTVNLMGVEIDSCRLCGGVWLDSGEIGEYVKKGKIPKKVLDNFQIDDSHMKVEEGKRKCPRCKNQLRVITHRRVNVDFCDECRGIWFDKGELKKIIATYQKETQKKSLYQPYNLPDSQLDSDESIIRLDGFDEIKVEPTKTDSDEENNKRNENEIEKELFTGGDVKDLVQAAEKGDVKLSHHKSNANLPMNTSSMIVSPMGSVYESDSPRNKIFSTSSRGYGHRTYRNSILVDLLDDFLCLLFSND